MVATLSIVEQNNRWLASLQTMIDLQAWRGWYMQTSSMPKSNSDVRTTPSRSFAAVYCFSQANAFQEPLDAPCLHKSIKEVVPLTIKITNRFNPTVKSHTKNSTI